MRKSFFFLFLIIFLLPRLGHGDEASHRGLADELLRVTRVEKTIRGYFDQVKAFQMALLKKSNSGAKGAEKIKAVQGQIDTLLDEELRWENIKADYIDLYVKEFTEKELKSLIVFYKTPVGHKFINRMPALMRKSMQVTQKYMKEIFPKIQKIVERETKKGESP